jgi:hypothetical protein
MDPKTSLTYLQRVLDNNGSVFIDEAYFYVGLAHLKLESREEARQYLRLSSMEESKRLLEALNEK